MKCLQNLKEKNRVTFLSFQRPFGRERWHIISTIICPFSPGKSFPFLYRFCITHVNVSKLGDQQKSKIFQAILSFLAIVEVSNF